MKKVEGERGKKSFQKSFAKKDFFFPSCQKLRRGNQDSRT